MVMMFWYYLMAKWPLQENSKISWIPNWQWQIGTNKVSMMLMENELMGMHQMCCKKGHQYRLP